MIGTWQIERYSTSFECDEESFSFQDDGSNDDIALFEEDEFLISYEIDVIQDSLPQGCAISALQMFEGEWEVFQHNVDAFLDHTYRIRLDGRECAVHFLGGSTTRAKDQSEVAIYCYSATSTESMSLDLSRID